MTDSLSPAETQQLQHLLGQGYARAAASFATLAGQPVRSEAVWLSLAQSFDLAQLESLDAGPLTVLTTHLQGELTGKSLLILSQAECETLWQMQGFDKAYGAQHPLWQPLLLEVDNILSAAVITHFANVLGKKMYGGVPTLHEGRRPQLLAALAENTDQPDTESCFLFSNARLVFENNALMNPYFIWRLPQTFLRELSTRTAVQPQIANN